MEENKKIVNKLYIIIALLGLIMLILGGFLAYRELSSSKDDKINTEENNNNQNNNSSEIEELDVNSDLVVNLYKKIYPKISYDNSNGIFEFDSSVTVDFHNNSTNLASEITDKEKFSIVIHNLLTKKYNQIIFYGEYEIPYSEFEKEFYSLFGKDSKLEFKNFDLAKNYANNSITNNNIESSVAKVAQTYNSKVLASELYMGVKLKGSNLIIETTGDSFGSNRYLSKITKAIKEADTISIYEKAVYVSENVAYKNKNKMVNDSNNNISSDFSLDKFNNILEYLDTYKYIFKLNEDGTYRFYSSEKVESGKDDKINDDTNSFNEVSVKCGEKKIVKIGNKNVEISNSNFEIIVDGKKLYSDMNSCGDNVYIINNKLLIITDSSYIAFYDESLNKISYLMEENDSDIIAHTTTISGEKTVPYVNRYGKIIVYGTRSVDYVSGSIYLNGEIVDVCEGEKIKQDIYDKVFGKIESAEYELSYVNNKLTFKRVEGSEYKIDNSYCRY